MTVVLGVPALLGALGGAAFGHALSYPRMVHVRFGPELVEVAIQVNVHAGAKARALRDRHDVDKDGLLSEDETQALARTLDAEGRSRLRIRLDGTLLQPEVGVLDMKVEPGVDEGESLALKSVAAVALVLRPGIHEVEIVDMPPSLRATVPLRVEGGPFAITVGESQEEAMPLTLMGRGSWLGGFAGEGGAVHFTIDVPLPGGLPAP